MSKRYDRIVGKLMDEHAYMWLVTMGAIAGLGFAAWAALLFFPGR